MEITGQTKLAGIIGDPVEHSLSPAIQNAAFNHLNINCVYIPLHVYPEQLSLVMQTIKAFFVGINVTMPYKQDVIPYMDEIDLFAQLVGAVNTIKVDNGRLLGFNTDGVGFLQSLKQELGFSPENRRIAIIGAGGATRSVAMSIAQSKAEKLTIINRNINKAHSIKKLINDNFKDIKIEVLSLSDDLPKFIHDFELIINATPVGMESDESPIDSSILRSGQLVADLIYRLDETKFLREAKKSGAKTMSGKSMLLYQGAASFEIWTKESAPVDVMKNTLEVALKK